jgi:hypothetical protein
LVKSNSKREPLFDYLRSLCMLFVFVHHFYLTFPGTKDYLVYLNPFAELFVGLAGFMVGMVYLHRNKNLYLVKRGFKILFTYYVVALPIGMVMSQIGDYRQPIVETIVRTITFQEATTMITILIFYGIIFILLPVILHLYRLNNKLVLFSSILLFVLSTIIYNILNIDKHNFFITYTVMILLQWQMFFIIGLLIGDQYKKGAFQFNKFKPFLIIFGILALTVQLVWFRSIPIKAPYSIEKFLGLVYLAPLYLYVFTMFYKKIKNGRLDQFIRVVGRNSLVAFVLSEILRYGIYAVFVVFGLFRMNDLFVFVFSILLSIILILILKLYEDKKSQIKSLQIKRVMIKEKINV